jgi:hydrogenase nickel incorporation protein HypB
VDDHPHPHDHVHPHGSGEHLAPGAAKRTRVLHLEQEVLAKNNRIAAANRALLRAQGVLALNLMSSPGAGKTTLLERTIRILGRELPLCVIEGDQETELDAERIRATGCPVVQVNTGTGCHLDAEMVSASLQRLAPPRRSVVLIENVGNLVCPALFDLGEQAKVVLMSVTEGEDKPLKYPHVFRASELLLLNKVDLLPHVSFDVERCIAHARGVHPGLEVLQVSSQRGDGLDAWCDWVRARTGR